MDDRKQRAYALTADAEFEATLMREHHEHQRALRAEMQRPAPDMTRVRGLRDQIASTRAKLAALHGEPPPHTD